MDNHNDYPYTFDSNACRTCGGKCCRGLGGYVWLTIDELARMARIWKMDVSIFSRQYVRQVDGRLSLQERVINGEHFCCFFDHIDQRCTIYPGRPDQCRTFPFWGQFREEQRKLLADCPGVSLR